MYDNGVKLSRNDLCWCGSNKKYKKCHLAFDQKLEELALRQEEVLPRSLVKTAADIEAIKLSAEVNIGVLDYVGTHIRAGITTEEIDRWVYEYTVAHDAIPADLNFEGYPKSCCISVNDVVCHGIPSADVVLKDGDIVNVDCSSIKDGYFSDSSRMYCIGEVNPSRQALVACVNEAVERGLAAIKPWGHLGDVAFAVQSFVEASGFNVVREFGGHGIGKEFHEEPFVSYVGEPGSGCVLMPGFCFTIEPMINAGGPDIFIDEDNGWIVHTQDGSDSAQREVQVVVNDSGYELLSW